MTQKSLAFAAVMGLLAAGGVAHANTYTFSFSGGTDSGSGIFIGTLDAGLTGITGSVNGETITGLSNYGYTGTGTANTLTTAGPHLEYNGVGFVTTGDTYNLYYNNIPNDGAPEGIYLIRLSTDPDPNAPNAPFGQLVSFSTSAPEPATWAMMLVGLGLTGAALRRRAARGEPVPA